jgi:hypothetical protein
MVLSNQPNETPDYREIVLVAEYILVEEDSAVGERASPTAGLGETDHHGFDPPGVQPCRQPDQHGLSAAAVQRIGDQQ